MARRKVLSETDEFQARVANVLADSDDWQGYEVHRRWLQKLLGPEHGEVYTPAERAAVGRIAAARTPFEGWGGYSVPELIAAAMKYVADLNYEDELFLKELEARGAIRLRLDDMRYLVGLCRVAGLDLIRFDHAVGPHDDAA